MKKRINFLSENPYGLALVFSEFGMRLEFFFVYRKIYKGLPLGLWLIVFLKRIACVDCVRNRSATVKIVARHRTQSGGWETV
jgi:hypothetical protein